MGIFCSVVNFFPAIRFSRVIEIVSPFFLIVFWKILLASSYQWLLANFTSLHLHFDTELYDFSFLSSNWGTRTQDKKRFLILEILHLYSFIFILYHQQFALKFSESQWRVSNKLCKEDNSLLLQHSIFTPWFWYCAVKYSFLSFNWESLINRINKVIPCFCNIASLPSVLILCCLISVF